MPIQKEEWKEGSRQSQWRDRLVTVFFLNIRLYNIYPFITSLNLFDQQTLMSKKVLNNARGV